MDNDYSFSSSWHITAPLASAERVLLDAPEWTSWWRGLARATVTNNTTAVVGTVVDCVWRSSTGYRLKLTLTITSYVPGEGFFFTSTGDLEGEGSWLLQAEATGTLMNIDWHVHTTKPWMNRFSRFLRPLFVRNHHRLMQQGEVGLNKYLSDK